MQNISSSIRNPKPLISVLISLIFVFALTAPFLSTEALAGPSTPWDVVQAGTIHWVIVGALALLWLGLQLFWRAPAEATKLGMAASATVLWLSLVLFFQFNPPGGDFDQSTVGGAVAFFALVGGLGVVLAWTRFLADDITY
jgi:hypothetical protein